jgi:transposase
MVMLFLPDRVAFSSLDTPAATGRRAKIVGEPEAASPELGSRPRRRSAAAKDKLRILEAADRAAGVPGAIMRREGLYSSALTDWRRQRAAGVLSALKSSRRGPKRSEPNPLMAEHARLLRDSRTLNGGTSISM